MSTSKRKYTKLSASTWAEVRALWEVGDVTLAELSENYGVSGRALQSHFSRHGTTKGAKAAELAAAVKRELIESALPNTDELTRRARDTREAAYANAVIIESLVMAQLQAAQKDPTQALKAASAIKALSLAAAAVERLHGLKQAALGLNDDGVLADELPVLQLVDLTENEIHALQNRDEDDDFDDPGDTARAGVPRGASDDDLLDGAADDDVVVESENDEVGADGRRHDKPVALTPEGYRYVRGGGP
jgi:hypothetical protein